MDKFLISVACGIYAYFISGAIARACKLREGAATVLIDISVIAVFIIVLFLLIKSDDRSKFNG